MSAFQPALPLDASSLLYGIAGIFIGWLIYGAIKTPFMRRKVPAAPPKEPTARKPRRRTARPKVEPVLMPHEPDQARQA